MNIETQADTLDDVARYVLDVRGLDDARLWTRIATALEPEATEFMTVSLLSRMARSGTARSISDLFLWLAGTPLDVVEAGFIFAPDSDHELTLSEAEGLEALDKRSLIHPELGIRLTVTPDRMWLYFTGTSRLRGLLGVDA